MTAPAPAAAAPPAPTGWDDLVAAAVLGTTRRRPDAALPAALGRTLAAALAAGDPESHLLSAAAATALYRAAGRAWLRATDAPPAAAPDEEARPVGPAAAARLRGLLAGRDRGLLPEWLAVAAARPCLVPPVLLPALLDLATARADLRPAARTVGGRRGGWLAAQRATWAWALPAADPAAWTHPDRTVRRRHLEARRAEDPGDGLALLAGAWPDLDADLRATLLAGLAVRLGPGDEAFLEAALDDRRKPVRAAAADLLAALPGSALAARMTARLEPLVHPGADGVAVDLPGDCPPGWERDGVEPRPPRGAGARSWWLEQLVAAAPLRWWEGVTGRTPADLVAGGPGDPVRAGWETAAVRGRQPAWAAALLGAADPAPLLAVLPADDVEAWQRAAAATAAAPLAAVLARLEAPRPWSPEVSAAVLDRVARVAGAVDPAGRRHPDELALRGALGRLGTRLHPALAATASARLGVLLTPGAPWARSLTGLVETLATRQALLQELRT